VKIAQDDKVIDSDISDSVSQMIPKIGDVVADYKVIGILGQGGMGTVFRVKSLISDREEALKVVTSDVGSPSEASARFQREIKIQASLDHPNIAALRAAFWSGNQLMMVMELVDGINLDERLRQGPVSISDALRWVSDVLSALSYAHAAGVIHRDIKPANIVITPAGNAKLTDFGIARSVRSPNLTNTGIAVGSIFYMSPEVIDALEPDVRSDIYSAGVTLYELLTEARPWGGRNHYEIMKAKLESDVRSPDALNPEIEGPLASVVLRAIAKQPNRRFQTAAEFLEALEPCRISQAAKDREATGRVQVKTQVKTKESSGPKKSTGQMGARAVPAVLTLTALIAAAGLVWAGMHYVPRLTAKMHARPATTSTQPVVATVVHPVEPAAPTATITVDPPTLTMSSSETVSFTASVEHGSSQAVEWSVNPSVGSISSDGSYSAPASIPQQQNVEIIATSAGDSKISGKAVVTLLPVAPGPAGTPAKTAEPPATAAVAEKTTPATADSAPAAAGRITPVAVNLDASETRQFSVTPKPENAVHWSLKPQLGSISQRGLYTAPPVVSQEQHLTVIADSGSPIMAKITLQPVAVSAIASTKDPNGAMTFTATATHAKNTKVAWSISPQTGSISPQGVYTPAAKVNAPFDLTVTARSLADPSKFAQLAVNFVPPVSPVKITLNPFNPVLMDNQRQMLSATVTGTSDRSVTWTMVGEGTLMPNGLYIAPQHISPGEHTIRVTVTSDADPSKSVEAEITLKHAVYSGPLQGTLVWSGNIEKNETLTIGSSQASSGTLTGSLPGVPIAIRVNTSHVTVVTAPMQSNGWKSIVLRTGAHVHSILIDWYVAPEKQSESPR
jgi:serine/threonine protein kinase